MNVLWQCLIHEKTLHCGSFSPVIESRLLALGSWHENVKMPYPPSRSRDSLNEIWKPRRSFIGVIHPGYICSSLSNVKSGHLIFHPSLSAQKNEHDDWSWSLRWTDLEGRLLDTHKTPRIKCHPIYNQTRSIYIRYNTRNYLHAPSIFAMPINLLSIYRDCTYECTVPGLGEQRVVRHTHLWWDRRSKVECVSCQLWNNLLACSHSQYGLVQAQYLLAIHNALYSWPYPLCLVKDSDHCPGSCIILTPWTYSTCWKPRKKPLTSGRNTTPGTQVTGTDWLWRNNQNGTELRTQMTSARYAECLRKTKKAGFHPGLCYQNHLRHARDDDNCGWWRCGVVASAKIGSHACA